MAHPVQNYDSKNGVRKNSRSAVTLIHCCSNQMQRVYFEFFNLQWKFEILTEINGFSMQCHLVT